MDRVIKNYEDVDSWKTVMFLYQSALKEVGTKLEILNDEFQHVHQYNPIEHIKTRVKTAESIVKKLKRYGYETSIENMVKYINDIAGVRLICSFTSDIYRLAEMIGNQSDLKIISRTRKKVDIRVIICWCLCRFSCLTVLLIQKLRYRFGPLPWISGQVWNIRYIINLREMHRITSAGSCGNVRRWYLR